MILFGFCVFFRYGSNVLDGQERISSGVDECDEAGAGDEVDRAGGYGGMKVEADKDESSTYAVMLASDVPQRYLFFNSEKNCGTLKKGMWLSELHCMMNLGLTPAACSGRMEF
ncbi:uncharacterized protein LOC126586777 isoform X2 [Malus sylvestris]|uniref:uncharacterized protein LOC126586777 isoform X2 n=1 Tax=Malus sylvestris TaxID=3752 RepID=UPI0021ACFD09|nr:uncharacterized protein LOC126586777 isoform X2 [Malus sylvestris]